MHPPPIPPFLVAFALLLASQAIAAAPFEGPIKARVIKVLDGDTFLAEAELWPGQSLRIHVRLRGIDTPERKARCSAERHMASAAREALARHLGDEVRISNIAGAKYYGRVLADVAAAGGADVSAQMLRDGLARPYAGGRRAGWCD
jgi:endonuclease YncB( thermonuclease family)